MIMKKAVADENIMKDPRIKRTILPFPIHRSLEAALILESAKFVMEGSMIVNNAIFTPARNDRSIPACSMWIVSDINPYWSRKQNIGRILAWDRVHPYLFDTY